MTSWQVVFSIDIHKIFAIISGKLIFADLSINLYHPLQRYKSYSKELPMEKLIIRKAIAEDRDSIFEIFESQDTKWDIPYARKYYDDYFNDANPDDMVFVGVVDGKF
jgi:hypothetical protein